MNNLASGFWEDENGRTMKAIMIITEIAIYLLSYVQVLVENEMKWFKGCHFNFL